MRWKSPAGHESDELENDFGNIGRRRVAQALKGEG